MPGFKKRSIQGHRQSKNIQDRRNQILVNKDDAEIVRGLEKVGIRPGSRTVGAFRDAFRKGQGGVDVKEFEKQYRQDVADQWRSANKNKKKPVIDLSGSVDKWASRSRMMAKRPVVAPDDVLDKGFSKKNKIQTNSLGKKLVVKKKSNKKKK